jgi:hypothetical protein
MQLRRYMHATILEIAGKKAEALALYQGLEPEVKAHPGSFKDAVEAGIKRTS